MDEEQQKELQELHDVPPAQVIFEDSITDETQLKDVSTDEKRKEELKRKLLMRQENWGVGFPGGPEAINISGRPRSIPQLSKLTNRQIRERELLNLCRKIKPYQTKAIQTLIKILDNPDSSEQNKIKAAVFITQFYKDLLKDTFDYRYDDDQGKEVDEKKEPVFSLKMINPDEK
jgi:hypothetical protein